MIALTLWESPKFDAVTCQLTDNKLVNNTRAVMVSGVECPIGTKAAKTAVRIRDVDVDIDPDGDVIYVKESDGS